MYTQHLTALDFQATMLLGLPGAQRAQQVLNANAAFFNKAIAGAPSFTRNDSISGDLGYHLATELEYVYQEVRKQDYSDLKLLDLIKKDTRVPTGATSYTIRSEDSVGSAQYHRGGSYSVPSVAVVRDEETRPVRHIVTGFGLDFFALQSLQFSRQPLRERMQETARRVVAEFLNEKLLTGSVPDDVYGLLNYPYFPKTVSSVEIGPNSVATVEAQLDELVRLAQINRRLTDDKNKPDTLIMPANQFLWIESKQIAYNGDQSTMLEALKRRAKIENVISMGDLKQAGGSGTDVFIFLKADQRSVASVVPTDFTMLPAQQGSGFSGFWVPCYMSHGGINSFEPLNQLIVETPHSAE